MLPPIDREVLNEYLTLSENQTRDSLDLTEYAAIVDRFGWLAPWWLHATVREKAALAQPAYQRYTSQPRLPTDPGGCWAICVGNPEHPLLADAFLIPLCWRAGADDVNLPRSLVDLAAVVRDQVRPTGAWGLHLAAPPEAEAVDLSPLDAEACPVASAWASVFGGLALALINAAPRPKVWASAAWNDSIGVGPVTGLPAKLRLALDCGAEQFFVSDQNFAEAAEWARGTPLRIVRIAASVGKEPPTARRVLAEYLQQLETPPDAIAPFEIRAAHYARIGRRDADGYYWSNLLADAIKRCRENLPEPIRHARPTHVVSVVSNLPTVVALAPAVLQARHCLLLHEETSDIVRNRDKVAAFLRNRGITVHLADPLTLGDRAIELAELKQRVEKFAQGIDPTQLACDLTPGFKSLSLELQEVAPRTAWMMYCRHRQLPPDNRVDPGTERFDCWQRNP